MARAEVTWWLYRDQGRRARTPRTVFTFLDEPYDDVAAPLFALAVAGLHFGRNEARPPLALPIGRFEVELGSRIRCLEGGPVEVFGGDEFAQPGYRESFHLSADEEVQCGQILSSLGDWIIRLDATSPAAERFFRAVRHFLRGAVLARGRFRPHQETVFQWMTALEVLLSGGGQRGGYAATFTTNAAWLGGMDDTDRKNIRVLTRALYDAGSRYRHGLALYQLNERGQTRHGSPGELNVSSVDRLVRRLLLHAVALLGSGEDVPTLCGEAHYQRAASERLQDLLKSFYRDVRLAFEPFS